MGKQTEGINGGFRGTVGTVVGYMWRGQWCMRARPRFYHDAKTEAQLEQRELFKATVAYAGRVREVLRTGFHAPALAAHKTECNYFLKVNKGCFAMADGELAVDYEHLRVSEGPVAPVGFGEAVLQSDTVISIPFEKNPEHRRAYSDDKVYVAAFCDNPPQYYDDALLSLPVYRRTGSITVSLPDAWAGHEVHLYGFVQDNAGRTSDSVYLGAVTLEYTPEQEGVALGVPPLPAEESSPVFGVIPYKAGQQIEIKNRGTLARQDGSPG